MSTAGHRITKAYPVRREAKREYGQQGTVRLYDDPLPGIFLPFAFLCRRTEKSPQAWNGHVPVTCPLLQVYAHIVQA